MFRADMRRVCHACADEARAHDAVSANGARSTRLPHAAFYARADAQMRAREACIDIPKRCRAMRARVPEFSTISYVVHAFLMFREACIIIHVHFFHYYYSSRILPIIHFHFHFFTLFRYAIAFIILMMPDLPLSMLATRYVLRCSCRYFTAHAQRSRDDKDEPRSTRPRDARFACTPTIAASAHEYLCLFYKPLISRPDMPLMRPRFDDAVSCKTFDAHAHAYAHARVGAMF